MASVNKVILVGNLGADPQSRSFQNGGKVVNMRIATSETWEDKSTGEKRERTEWHSVVIFNEGLANTAERYLRKGSKVYIEGALQTRKWQDQSGADRYSTEVVLQGFKCQLVMLDGRSDGDSGRSRSSVGVNGNDDGFGGDWGGADATGRSSSSSDPFAADLDDDVPF